VISGTDTVVLEPEYATRSASAPEFATAERYVSKVGSLLLHRFTEKSDEKLTVLYLVEEHAPAIGQDHFAPWLAQKSLPALAFPLAGGPPENPGSWHPAVQRWQLDWIAS
jgi:hypothetical protein